MMIYKHYLWNLPTKITFSFLFNLSFRSTFYIEILSYFAIPNFIIYDEWFDDNLEKTKLDAQNKNIKTISNIHDFFYEQSNFKIGASENNMQLDIKVNKKDQIINHYLDKVSEINSSTSTKKFKIYKTFINSKFKFNITKKLIYTLSIFGIILIFGFQLFYFISQSKKNESKIINNSFSLNKKINFLK